MRDLRGRGHGFPFPGDGASTLPAESDAKYNGAGFRLAVVNDYEQVAGGNFRLPEESAGVMRIGHRGPPEKYPNVGIRLCAAWEEK